MKQNKLVRKCGPYEVHSISQDHHGVRLEVFPAFPQYNISEKEQKENGIDPYWADEPRWALHRYKGEGGGPGIFMAVALAEEFEKFLNQSYPETEVMRWKTTLAQALKKVRQQDQRRFERAMANMEKRHRPLPDGDNGSIRFTIN